MRGARAKVIRKVFFGEVFPRPSTYRQSKDVPTTFERADNYNEYRTAKKVLHSQ